MNIEQFISKYEGKGIDVDGFPKDNPFQCTDLYRQYVKEVLNYPQSPSVKSAKDIWNNFLISHFVRIENTPESVPQKGDVVIWGDKYGVHGHIALCLSANVKNFVCFSQNDPVGAKCIKKTYSSYRGVLGWLRPKNATINDDMAAPWLRQMFLEVGFDIDKPEGEVRGRVQEVVDGYKKTNDLQVKIAKLEKDLIGSQSEMAGYEKEAQLLQGKVAELNKEVEDQKKITGERDREITILREQITQMATDIEVLKKQLDPDTTVILSKEEYEKLTAKKTLDRFTATELIAEVIKRITHKK